jgi:hypothetical protein
MTAAILFAIAGLALVIVSFATWSRPSAFGLKGSSDQWQTTRGVLFGLWTLALPIYALWEWYHFPHPENLQAYIYEHKIWSDVWTAGAVVLALLFGIKK